jgi:uncharacterized MAPEG superfamily protein
MPIVLWCVVAVAVLQVLAAGLAKWGAPDFDNANPRAWAAGLGGWRARAFAAHQNGYEIFPFFAAAAIVATTRGAPEAVADLLGVAVLTLRLGYLACYVADAPTLRSAVWTLGFLAVTALFTMPAWAAG